MPDDDVKQLHESIRKIASTVNKSARFTEQIPEIKRKVDSTSGKVIELDTKMSVTTERMAIIENKVDRGHDCYQVDVIAELKDDQRDASQKIDTDVQKGIEQREKLAALTKEHASTEADVEDIKKAPRRMFYSLLGVIVVLVSGGLSAAWFLAQLERNVIHEQQQREERDQRIENQIKTLATKVDPAPVQRDLKTLTKAVKVSNGHEEEFNSLCSKMTNYEKRFTRDTLRKRLGRVPESCLE